MREIILSLSSQGTYYLCQVKAKQIIFILYYKSRMNRYKIQKKKKMRMKMKRINVHIFENIMVKNKVQYNAGVSQCALSAFRELIVLSKF